jgi:hypothetical protein
MLILVLAAPLAISWAHAELVSKCGRKRLSNAEFNKLRKKVLYLIDIEDKLDRELGIENRKIGVEEWSNTLKE